MVVMEEAPSMAGAIVESWWLLFLLERLRLKQQLLSEPVKEDISNSQVKNPQVKTLSSEH